MTGGNDYSGTLVAVEGLDGAGKTTVANEIARWADEEDIAFVQTREPTDMWTGEAVYDALSRDEHPLTDFHMFVADRAKHVEERIVPALEDGKLVVTDRYADSTRAYQTPRLADETAMSKREAEQWMETVFEPIAVEPDVTIYLDITVDEAVERCAGGDKYERRAQLEAAKDEYAALYHRCDGDVRIIDGEKARPHVARLARNTVKHVHADSRAGGAKTYTDAIEDDD
jgi:dTMP kinase